MISESISYSDISDLLPYITAEEKEIINAGLAKSVPIWTPLEGPQRQALDSPADVLFYGGSAGGGKTDLIVGLALIQHIRSIIFRREGTQLVAIIDRLAEILRTRDGLNGQTHVWRLPNKKQIEFGSTPNSGDEAKYQGRPHDLIAFDEISNFLESQFRFLCGWARTTIKGQRCRIVCAGNPPTSAEGEWVIKYWGPWLDPNHPYPAKPGELRWYAMMDGKETEVDTGKPFSHNGKMIIPQSRTFIPSKVQDNPFLMDTNYEAMLQALPEPLRSQMLDGSFSAGKEDSVWQVIPTAWIETAMSRWTEQGRYGQMDSIGVDVARGGRDKTVISARYGKWYSKLQRFLGADTPDGAMTAGLVVSTIRDGAPVHVDVIGVGSSVYDHLKGANVHTIPVNSAEAADVGATDRSMRLHFRNRRAQLWWKFREMLEPRLGEDIALPPDSKLKADLCAPQWKLTPGGILIESKDDIKKRLGRSPDDGDAVIYASIITQKQTKLQGDWRNSVRYSPRVG